MRASRSISARRDDSPTGVGHQTVPATPGQSDRPGNCRAESETIAIYCINQKSVLYPVWPPDQPGVLAFHFPPARTEGERDFLTAGAGEEAPVPPLSVVSI